MADICDGGMDLRLHRFQPRSTSPTRLWQTIRPQRPTYSTEIEADPPRIGVMSLTSDNRLRSSNGALRPR